MWGPRADIKMGGPVRFHFLHISCAETDVPIRRRSFSAAKSVMSFLGVRRIERFYFICAVGPFHRNLDIAFPAKSTTRLTMYRGIHENVKQSGRCLDANKATVNSDSEAKSSLKSRTCIGRTRHVRVFVSFEKRLGERPKIGAPIPRIVLQLS